MAKTSGLRAQNQTLVQKQAKKGGGTHNGTSDGAVKKNAPTDTKKKKETEVEKATANGARRFARRTPWSAATRLQH